MKDSGYSTIIDAVLFLVMVSACAIILNSAISGDERQRATSDASLRSLSSSTLATMETVKVDHFEYNILGDRIDSLAEICGISTGSWLYKDTAKAVLGRGNRHKTVMEIAAEDAACQFTLRYENNTLKLNPLTGDYDNKARAMVESSVRQSLDARYDYHFTLRWVPFTGVPLEGSISCGDEEPPGAASTAAYVTLPYRTNVTRDSIEKAITPELEDIEKAAKEHRSGGSTAAYRDSVRASLDKCLENSSGLMVHEVMGNTIYEVLPAGDVGNPLSMLATFSDDDNVSAGPLVLNGSIDLEGALCRMIVQYNAGSLDRLADDIVGGTDDGTMDAENRRARILDWMQSMYNPSRARVTLSVWVRDRA